MARAPRNTQLIPGVSRLSRSQSYQARLLWKRKKTAVAAPEKAAAPEAKPRFYPAEDAPRAKTSRKTVRPQKLRSSITPGTVLILLAGRFAGKRVVYLKRLESGLLLVTGPHKINGVPLRRVNQAYVISTSTKLDISKVKISDKVNDAFFAKEKTAKKATTEEQLFKDYTKRTPVNADRAKIQKETDKQLLPLIKKSPMLKSYLAARFALSKGQYPHALKF